MSSKLKNVNESEMILNCS